MSKPCMTSNVPPGGRLWSTCVTILRSTRCGCHTVSTRSKAMTASSVNEYDLVPTQVDFVQPGTIFGSSPAGGLGWGLGASIGVKLAAPDQLVIATLGDGSYMFGNPTPCHFVSQAYELPTLTVIFNNRVWNAVRRANLGMYPNGWAAKTQNFPLSEMQAAATCGGCVTAAR